jgi:hypothetical protein
MYWGGAAGEGPVRVGGPLYVHVGCGGPGFFIESYSFSKKEGKKQKNDHGFSQQVDMRQQV